MGGTGGGTMQTPGGGNTSTLPTWNASTSSWTAPTGGTTSTLEAAPAGGWDHQGQYNTAKAAMEAGASQGSQLSLPSWITAQGNAMTGSGTPTNGLLGQALGMGGTPGAPTGETGGGGVTPLPGSPGAFQLAGPTTGGPGTNLVGAPPWMQDFYAQGGGDLNAYWQKMAGQVNTQQQPAAPVQTFAKPKVAAKAAVKPAVKAAVKPAAAAAAPQYTLIPMNAAGGYNQPGLQQPMAVSDQWNPSTGSSGQVASTAPGSAFNAPQVMGGPIYTDNKGGYFSKDAKTGKIVPITNATALAAAKGVGKSFGYM